MAKRVPHGGGQYLVGRPYTVAGRRYYPAENPSYTAVGMASWYGAAFHGRRTANGEVYDMASLSAAHPTMPLPSYARVTNLQNGYSVIVRVNDRGPYHAGRVMDVSSRVADVLDMKAMGTAKVKVDYVGAAPIEGSDDSQLLASLRTDGSPANMIGYSAPVMMASAAAEQTETIWSFFSGGGRGGQQTQPQPQPEAQPTPAPAPEPPPVQVASAPEPPPPPEPVRVAAAPVDSGAAPAESGDTDPLPPEPIRSAHLTRGAVPLPPPRPFDLSLSRSSTVAAAAVVFVTLVDARLVRACCRAAASAGTSRQRREGALFGVRSSAAQEADDRRLRSREVCEDRSGRLLEPLHV